MEIKPTVSVEFAEPSKAASQTQIILVCHVRRSAVVIKADSNPSTVFRCGIGAVRSIIFGISKLEEVSTIVLGRAAFMPIIPPKWMTQKGNSIERDKQMPS